MLKLLRHLARCVNHLQSAPSDRCVPNSISSVRSITHMRDGLGIWKFGCTVTYTTTIGFVIEEGNVLVYYIL